MLSIMRARSAVALSFTQKVNQVTNASIHMGEFGTNITNNPEDNGGKGILEPTENRISIELSPHNDLNVKSLTKLTPHFVSVTWLGTAYLSLPNDQIPAVVLARKLNCFGFPVLLHLTGRNLNKQRLYEILNLLKGYGIKYILAVQGDWPHVLEKDDTKCDFPYASNLVAYIKETFGDSFTVGVAAYPSLHPHSKDVETDIKYLKEKVSKGAEFIVTQAHFEFESLENYVKLCRQSGIDVPVFPGVFVIKSHKTLINMARWCDFKVPREVLAFTERNQDNDKLIENYGFDLAEGLIRKILGRSDLFAGVHVFCMNDIARVEELVRRVKNEDEEGNIEYK